MTPQAEGSYFRPKHLEQTIWSYLHIIETGQAKPRQHYIVQQAILPVYPSHYSGAKSRIWNFCLITPKICSITLWSCAWCRLNSSSFVCWSQKWVQFKLNSHTLIVHAPILPGDIEHHNMVQEFQELLRTLHHPGNICLLGWLDPFVVHLAMKEHLLLSPPTLLVHRWIWEKNCMQRGNSLKWSLCDCKEISVICWWCTGNVAAINSTNWILKVGPEFVIIAYLRWDRLSTSG